MLINLHQVSTLHGCLIGGLMPWSLCLRAMLLALMVTVSTDAMWQGSSVCRGTSSSGTSTTCNSRARITPAGIRNTGTITDISSLPAAAPSTRAAKQGGQEGQRPTCVKPSQQIQLLADVLGMEGESGPAEADQVSPASPPPRERMGDTPGTAIVLADVTVAVVARQVLHSRYVLVRYVQ